MGTWPLMALMVAAGAGAAEQVLIRPDYGDAVAVAAAWQAGERTAPAEQVQRPDGPALRLPILFETNDSRRSYWDVPLSLDLTTARGLSFEVLCPDDSPVAYFNVYLRSGAGWYSRAWFTDSSGGWLRVNVLKAEMSTEDAPAGWGEISALRFSAWRAESADTELLVRNVALLGAPGPATRLAVVRQLGEVGGPYAQQMVGTLDSIGLEAVLIDEPDVTAARLAPFSVAILPNNPDLGEAAMDALEAFVVGGGRLFIAYSVPDRLRAMVGLPAAEYREQVRDGEFAQIVPRPGALPGAPVAVQASWNIAAPATTAGLEVLADWQDVEGQPSAAPALVASDRAVWLTHVWLPEGGPEREWLLLAALVHLEPQLDALAAEGLIARAMLIGPYAGYAQAAAVLAQRGGDPGALAGAESQLATARERLAVGDWAGARGQALAAGATARAAWAAAQPAEAGEWRAWWCHRASGLADRPWSEAARLLADHGFTAVVANLMWGGVSYGRSALLPAGDAERDYIAEALTACRAVGLELHLWKVNYNCQWTAPEWFVEQMRAEGRLQADREGKEERWLCPSDPRNQQLEIDSMVEAARLYDLDGLHFDYIRFPDGDHCFCAGCRERFGALSGDALADWPAAVDAGGRLRAAWLDWRRECINRVVQGVHAGARAARPGMKISAAVFPVWTSARDSIGQDAALWCERGWIDFVVPMDYTDSPLLFERYVRSQQGWAHGVPVRPGIGASATGIRMTPEEVIEQIWITRRQGTGGFCIFNFAVREATAIVPALGAGVTKAE